ASMEVPKEDRAQFTREHPYGKALQLKFSYALTAHKSQGGQWAKVFVDCPRIEDWHDLEWLRWLYTAITRTSDKLYLIGFPSDAYEDA
ncbi:MAG: ATP-binding domain-containing protein, partial [Schleiferiaceae bacterium]|nr:ATP-binding domain-containing protein [Schleiferiaceae bacterium]